jgi:hypoxanthine phosphoribosyltransferase
MILSLLRGGFMFTADLVRELHGVGLHPQMEFLILSSYGMSSTSSGKVTLQGNLSEEMKDRTVLIVDDILESGHTLYFARDLVKKRGAKEIKTVVLLEKPGKRETMIEADFVGFAIPDRFVVGYGLDYANYYRELPYIGIIDIH